MQYTMFYTTKLDASDISRCPSIATLTLLLIITFNLHHSTTQYQSLKRVEIGIKGQLIFKSKLSVNSSKKRTNEFVFTSMLRVFVRFLGESLARKKRFEIYWPLEIKCMVYVACSSAKTRLKLVSTSLTKQTAGANSLLIKTYTVAIIQLGKLGLQATLIPNLVKPLMYILCSSHALLFPFFCIQKCTIW